MIKDNVWTRFKELSIGGKIIFIIFAPIIFPMFLPFALLGFLTLGIAAVFRIVYETITGDD